MPQLITTGLIVLLASVVQGGIGFAYGLIAIPLLISAGYTLSQAVAFAVASTSIQVLISSIQLREHIPWHDVTLPAVIRFITVPLGALLLVAIETLDLDFVQRLVGFMVLAAVALRMVTISHPPRRLPMWLSVVIFAASGFITGLVAMGGPPLVLWATTRDYTSQEARAFTLILFTLNAPIQIGSLMLLSKTMDGATLLKAVLFVPVILLGTAIGVWIGNRISRRLLNIVAMSVLFVIAIRAIL